MVSEDGCDPPGGFSERGECIIHRALAFDADVCTRLRAILQRRLQRTHPRILCYQRRARRRGYLKPLARRGPLPLPLLGARSHLPYSPSLSITNQSTVSMTRWLPAPQSSCWAGYFKPRATADWRVGGRLTIPASSCLWTWGSRSDPSSWFFYSLMHISNSYTVPSRIYLRQYVPDCGVRCSCLRRLHTISPYDI